MARMALLPLLALGGCASTTLVTSDKDSLHVVAKRVEAAKADFRRYRGELVIGIGNRSERAKKIGAIEITLEPEGIGVGPITLTEDGGGESLGPGLEMELRLPVEWAWPQESEAFLKLVQAESVPLALTGSAQVGGERVDVRGAVNVALPALPAIIVRHVEATREGDLTSADLTFEIEVKNENPFPVKVKKVVGTIVLEEVEMVKDHLISGYEKVAANASHIINVPTEMTKETHGKKLRGLLRGGILAYTMTGTAKIHNIEVPINLSGEVTFPEF